MGEQQHIDWLCEGVAAWNARRQRDGFRPDFSDTDFQEALKGSNLPNSRGVPDLREANLMGADLREANLMGADLREADLREAHLRGADLREANLEEADLMGADLREANLMGADLREAHLRGADLREADLREADLMKANLMKADLREADVSTLVYSGSGINDVSEPEYTDLSTTKFLKQEQLDTMLGDSGTILPDHLTRPAPWPELELPTTVSTGTEDTPPDPEPLTVSMNVTEGAVQESSGQIASNLTQQVQIILGSSAVSAQTAKLCSDQLDHAVRLYRLANPTNTPPDDLILVEQFSDALKAIHTSLDEKVAVPEQAIAHELEKLLALVNELREIIDKQTAELLELSKKPTDTTSFQKGKTAFAVSFGTALGTGCAGIAIASADAMLGGVGANAIQGLRDAFANYFTAPLPPPPTLPPTTGV